MSELISDRIWKFREFLERSKGEKKRTVVLYGGGGSGKSVSLAQHLVAEAEENSEEGIEILCAMKTRPALKDAQWAEVHRVLDSWGMEYEDKESTLDIALGASVFHFRGMDDPEKLKSTGYNYIWMEEATSCEWNDYLQLKVRLRRPGNVPQQMFLSFNPIRIDHWIWSKVVNSGRKDVAVLHSNWRDNLFLSEDYVTSLLELENQDMNHYRIYALGEPGKIENLIYARYDVLDWVQVPMNVRDRPLSPDAYGLDWGYNHPMALVAYWTYDNEDYILEKIYKRRMTTEDLVARLLAEKVDANAEMFCPPEQPGVIETLCRNGFNARPVPSKARNVKDGIDYCRGRKLHVIVGSDNLLKELACYSYRTRRNTSEPIEEPVKINDDLMDAMRYARFSVRRDSAAGASGGTGVESDALIHLMRDAFWSRNQEVV